MDNAWRHTVDRRLKELQYRVSRTADRVLVEKIERTQEEALLKLHRSPSEGRLATKPESDAERMCMECVKTGNLALAFGTIVRYIDEIAASKAEKKAVLDKATRDYADQLFRRLGTICRQQIDESTSALEKALEDRIEKLEQEFNGMTAELRLQMLEADKGIAKLGDRVSQYASLAGRTSNVKKKNVNLLLLPREKQFESQTDLTPRRRVLQKSLELSRRSGSRPLEVPRVSELRETMQVRKTTTG